MFIGAAPQMPEQVPPRVAMAFAFVQWAESVQRGVVAAGESMIVQGRELSANERATYQAAIETIRVYVNGEMSFGNALPAATKPPEEPPAAGQGVPTGKD